MALPEVCFVYLVRTGPGGLEVLLAEPRTGSGGGRVIGIGGALDGDETPRDAAVRRVLAEIGVGVEASDLREAGVVDYHFPTRPAWSRRSTVFVCRRWVGDPVRADGVACRWYALADVPYARMWDDAVRWLPGVLRGGTVDARYTFGPDLTTVVLEAT